MKIVSLVLLLLFNTQVLAQRLRSVEMSWSPIQGAEKYEFKLFQYRKGKLAPLKTYQISSPYWNQQLSPGDYAFQVRSLDYREVPGPWSNRSDFSVKLPDVNQVSPVNNESVNLDEEGEVEINFRWDPISEATRYNFQLIDGNNKIIKNLNTKNSFTSISFDVPSTYSWKVTALGAKDKAPTQVKFDKQFIIHPPKIAAPEVNLRVENKFLKIGWTTNSASVKEVVSLYKKTKSRWKKIYTKTMKKTNMVSIVKRKVPKGSYKVKVYAYSESGDQSKAALAYFDWDKSDLSNVRNESQKNKSNDNFVGKKSPHSFSVGFALVDISYEATLFSLNTKVGDTITGQKFHYWHAYEFSTKSYIDGEVSIYELVNNTDSWILLGLRSSYNYRFSRGRHALTGSAGLIVNDLPYISGTPDTTEFTRESAKLLGLELGGDYTWTLHRFWKVGTSLDLTLYSNALSNPNSSGLSPSMASKFSMFGEYWIKSDIALKAYFNVLNTSLTFGDDEIKTTGTETGMQFVIDL